MTLVAMPGRVLTPVAPKRRSDALTAFADILVTFDPTEVAITGTKQLGSPAPIITEYRSQRWRVWLVGELLQYGPPTSTAPFAQWCDDLDQGCPRPHDLNGHFAILAESQDDHAWHAWTNRLGTVHLYYGAHGGRRALGTFSPAVASAIDAKEIDWRALTGWSAFGFVAEDRTFLEDVRVVRPATHIVWDRFGQKQQESRYWHWHHQPLSGRSYEETLEGFSAVLDSVLRDQTDSGRLALPLSGGLDSRTIAAAATARSSNRASWWAFSYGYGDQSAETRIGEQLAARRQLAFEKFSIPPYLFERIDDVLDCGEGFQSLTTPRQISVSRQIAAHADFVVAAHWGDVWMDSMGISENGQSTGALVSPTRKKLEKAGGEWLLKHLVAPHLAGSDANDVLDEIVCSELGALDGIEEADFRLKAFKTDQWSFRWTVSGLRAYQAAAFPRLPFYDNRMVDFFCTVPTTFVTGRRLQIDYLKRYHPDLAAVTWQETDSSLFTQQYRNSWLVPKRAVKKARRLLTGQNVVERNWEVQFLSSGARGHLESNLLKPGLRLLDLLPSSDVRTLVTDFYKVPTPARGYAVSQLLTFAAWLERYC